MEVLIVIGLIILALGFWAGVEVKSGFNDFLVLILSLILILFISALLDPNSYNSASDPHAGIGIGFLIILIGPLVVPPFIGYWLGFSVRKLRAEDRKSKILGVTPVALALLFWGGMFATKDIRVDIRKAKFEQRLTDQKAENQKRKKAGEKNRLLKAERAALRATLAERYVQFNLNNFKLYLKPNSNIYSDNKTLSKHSIVHWYEKHDLKTEPLITKKIEFRLECDNNAEGSYAENYWCSRSKSIKISYEDFELNLAERRKKDVSYRQHMTSEEAGEQYVNEGEFGGDALKKDVGFELFLLRKSDDSRLARLHLHSALLFWRAPQEDAQGETIYIKCTRDKRRGSRITNAYFCETGWAVTEDLWVSASYEAIENETGRAFLSIKANAEEFWTLIQKKPDDFRSSIDRLDSE